MTNARHRSVIPGGAPVDVLSDNCDRVDVDDRHCPERVLDLIELDAIIWAEDPLLDASDNAAWLARHRAEAAEAEQWLASVFSETTDTAEVPEAGHLAHAVAVPGNDVRTGVVLTEGPQHKRSVTRSVASWVLFAAVCTVGWLTLGPAQLGGPASYVVVTGDSMEPTYHDGDLVIGRTKSSYDVGDIIVYDPKIDADFRVIHRIIDIRPDGRYVTQGDNRNGADEWYPDNDEVFGAAWARVPLAGSVIRILYQPGFWLAMTSLILAIAAIDLLRRSKRPAVEAKAHREDR